ncbi:hypothetical protein [Rhizobium leguminosarum]|uniref:hypothetical protein n=1 Tax=Rhizobium leguminosarum TaxID=384 RepID=UPI001C95A22C|nr:hypothetical protein [Rhizobium leguminosarum]MBY5728507.1 hypothetical protein [Rhizobium leguminosarum]
MARPLITIWEADDPLAARAEFEKLGLTAVVGNDMLLYLEGEKAEFLAMVRGYVRRG